MVAISYFHKRIDKRWRTPMAEVNSPVNRKGSKVGSNQPMSPGARTNPSRGGGPQTDSVPPPQASHGGASRHSTEEPGTTKVVGPED
jgi:hypothetical protein